MPCYCRVPLNKINTMELCYLSQPQVIVRPNRASKTNNNS